MRALLSNSLAEKLSLTGRNGKKAIMGTPIFDAICGMFLYYILVDANLLLFNNFYVFVMLCCSVLLCC